MTTRQRPLLRAIEGGAAKTGPAYTDSELFEGIASGDERIARELYRRLLPAVEGALYRVLGRREGSVTVLELSDTGPGLPQASRERLFEPFLASTRRGGTGLGLAIASELVHAHGGEIRLVDGTIGATFRVTIPDRPVALSERRAERARA